MKRILNRQTVIGTRKLQYEVIFSFSEVRRGIIPYFGAFNDLVRRKNYFNFISYVSELIKITFFIIYFLSF